MIRIDSYDSELKAVFLSPSVRYYSFDLGPCSRPPTTDHAIYTIIEIHTKIIMQRLYAKDKVHFVQGISRNFAHLLSWNSFVVWCGNDVSGFHFTWASGRVCLSTQFFFMFPSTSMVLLLSATSLLAIHYTYLLPWSSSSWSPLSIYIPCRWKSGIQYISGLALMLVCVWFISFLSLARHWCYFLLFFPPFMLKSWIASLVFMLTLG